MKLYEIDEHIRSVIETGYSVDMETGEVLFEVADLDELEAAKADKLEACALVLKEQRATVQAIKDEEKALAERRKAEERKAERMQAYILAHIADVGGKMETGRVKLSTRKSRAVVIDCPGCIPAEFVEFQTTEKVDKSAIAKAIKEGREVKGAHIEERENLAVK